MKNWEKKFDEKFKIWFFLASNRNDYSIYEEMKKFIINLQKHDCQVFMEEAQGCSICSKIFLKSPIKNKKDLKELQEYCNARIFELTVENEKLKEELKKEKSLLKCKCKKEN